MNIFVLFIRKREHHTRKLVEGDILTLKNISKLRY